MPTAPIRIAHRGMPRLARENTLPSFALALEHGAQGIELDVHATRDGVVVVHHDPALADGAVIAELTAAALQEHEAAPGVPVPTLFEVCTLIRRRAALFVEIKGSGIEALVADTLRTHEGDVAVHSFDHAMIARLHRLSPTTRLGILFDDDARRAPAVMASTGALDVWPHFPLADADLVAAVHGAGGRVIPWTVNDAAVAGRLAAAGVDALCGDDVRVFPGGARSGRAP